MLEALRARLRAAIATAALLINQADRDGSVYPQL